MTEKYGFVYIWRDRKHNRYYIGCHWGTVDDGYICSSNWMRDAFRRRPTDFRRRVLKTGLSRQEMYAEEQRVFSMMKQEELKTRYYNLRFYTPDAPWHSDDAKRMSVGEKISKANKGRKHGPCSPERAKAISEAKKGKPYKRTPEGEARWREAMKEYKPSEETKQKTSITLKTKYQEVGHPNKGKELSEAHRKAISNGMVGRKRNGYTQSDATKHAREKATKAATAARLGTKAYNNGIEEKRCKEHPGDGWVLGGLPRKNKTYK